MIQRQRNWEKQVMMAGLLLDLLYAFYHGVLGVRNRSFWFVTMCAYYSILTVMRFFAIRYSRKSGFGTGRDLFAAKQIGVLLVLLSTILAGVNYLTLSQNIAAQYGTIVMITIAAYTFAKITMAVLRAVKGRRNPSRLLAAIRCIGYAEVSASVFTMQKSMLVSFEGMSEKGIRLMNTLTGSAVWLFVLVLGLNILRRDRKGYGNIKACEGK